MNKCSERTSDIIERKRRYDQRWRANVWVGIKDNNMEKKTKKPRRKEKEKQQHVKDPYHSAKSAGGRLQLNTHTPLTQRSR